MRARAAPGRPAPSDLGHAGAEATGGCALTDLFRLFGKAHVLDILYVFHTEPGPHRFVDLQRRLGVSPNTLSERLKELVAAGLLTRTAYNEIPPRVDYEATTKTYELQDVFAALARWSHRHTLSAEPEPRPATA